MLGREKVVVEESKQLIVFRFGDEEFGMDILQVREVERMAKEITRVPKAPSFVEGVINLRGEVVPVVDLRKRFSLVLRPMTSDTRVLIVEINDNLVGMIVDEVVEVLRVPISALENAPQITKGVDAYFISGVAKLGERLIVLLNMERALSTEESQELAQANLESAE